MPRHTQIVRMCENHPDRPATDDEIPPVTWGGGPPMLFDCCEECWTAIVVPFMHLMAKGTKVDEVPASKPVVVERVVCPLHGTAAANMAGVMAPTHCTYTGESRKALSQHLRNFHGVGIRALKEAGITA